MWFAGMTRFKAVYVFDYNNSISLPANDFIHLIPGAFEIGHGNVRSRTFPRFYAIVVEVAAPVDVDATSTKMSRTFYGFDGNTKKDAIQLLVTSLGDS